MKKLIALAIAMLFLVPAFAMAEDKVSVSGSYNLFAYDMDNYTDLNDATDDEQSYFYHRFRVATTIVPADEIKAFFRFDLSEGTWGVDYNGGSARRGLTNTGTTGADHQIHIDYAWVKVDKEMWAIQVGQQYFGWGLGINEAITPGIRVTFKTPVTIDLYYAKYDENGSTSDDAKANEDEDLYGAQLGYKSDAFSADMFYVVVDDSSDDSDQWVFGLFGTAALGGVDLAAEFNTYGGDNGAGLDYTGTQLVLQGKFNVSEQLMIGGQFLYAQGSDDPTEIVIDQVPGDLWSFRPLSYGLMETWDCEPVNPFEIDTNAGMQAIQLICDYQATDALLFQGALAYAQPEEDDVTVVDSAIILNVSFKYTFATNAYFGLHYNWMSPDGDNGVDLDDASALMGRFTLSF